jgi:hypothetical protein
MNKKGENSMSSSADNYLPEPSQTWARMNYPDLPLKMNPRKRAELHTNRDLTKPIEQLLCDFHEMAERASPGGDLGSYPVQAMLHAQKRVIGMMAKVALSNQMAQRGNDEIQKSLHRLTVIGVWLTVISAFFGAIQAVGAAVSLFK